MAVFENSCNGNYGGGYRIRLEVTENSTDITNNTSNVTVVVKCYAINNSYGNYGFNNPTRIYIDSVEKAYNSPSTDYRNQRVNTLCSWTGDIEHDSLGNKTISVSASFSSTSSSLSGGSVSGSVALSYIPRKSSISATSSDIGSNTIISINRASNSFTHTITYTFGSLSGTIATKTSSTSISWEVPTSFYAQIPNSKTGTCNLTCVTYSGDTQIGSSTSSFIVTANETLCKPDLSVLVEDINVDTIALTGDSTKLIKYASSAKITSTSTAKNSATISKTTINGVEGAIRTITNVDTNEFEVIVTDSRGYSKRVLVTSSIINYIPLTANSLFKRVSSTSNRVNLTYTGNYWNDDFGVYNNTLSLSYKYREKGTQNWTTGLSTLSPTITDNKFNTTIQLSENFDYKKNWEFSLYYEDKLISDNTGINDVLRGLGSLEIYGSIVMSNGIIMNDLYSLNEIKIGIWIDNKPIYRKVIDIGTLPDSTTKSVSTGITNLDYVTKLYGMASTSHGFIALNDTVPNSPIYDTRLFYNKSNSTIDVITAFDRTGYSGYVIVEYTKTTD